MLNRNAFFTACVCLAASVAAFAQAGASYVFEIPAVSSGSSQLLGFAANTNNLSTASINAQGPVGTFQIIPKPDGTKFYLLGANSVQAADPGFTNFRPINGITGTPSSGAITPDGRYLLIGAGTPGNLYVIDTSSDQLVGNPAGLPGTVVPQYGIAITQDSRRAFVLTNPAFGSSVTAFDLSTRQRIGASPLSLPGGQARSITLSPLGLLYVTRGNAIDEIDPATVALTAAGTVPVIADPGPLHFTPDGSSAYCVNHNPSVGGASIIRYTPAKPNVAAGVATWPAYNPAVAPPLFDDIFIAGNSRAFAFSSQTTSLWDVTPAPLGATTSTLSAVLPVNNVVGVAISGELPSARSLFLMVQSGAQITLDRVDLTTNSLSVSGLSSVGVVPLEFVSVPPQSGAAAFIQYNNLQIVSSGGTSLPLAALVLDATGQPVYNLPVSFTTDPTNGAVINSPGPITNANGYVQTTVTVPGGQQGGVFTITLTAGAASTTFTLSVPGISGGGGGGGPGGVSQVTIVSGDGQLIYGQFGLSQPMVVKVTDTSGNPLTGVPVSFAVTSGTANLGTPNVTTDNNGLASSYFFITFQLNGSAYQANTITATTPYGIVGFTETAVPSQTAFFTTAAQPEIDLDSPSPTTGRSITIGAGSVLPNAIVARIYAAGSPQLGAPPIPGVGVSITNSEFDLTPSGAAHCQGDPLSDQNGKVVCNLVGACLVPGTVTPVAFEVGSLVGFAGQIKTIAGSASQIQKLAGDNQSGRAGQQLQTPLLAVITDGCGNPFGGAQVTWTVIQGSATLTGPSLVTDSKGRTTTQLTFGQTPGTVQVRLALAGVTQAVFTLSNQVIVAGISIVSGNNQNTLSNQPFAQPLTVSVVDTNNNPVSGVTVTFSVTSGSAAIPNTGPTTNNQGVASTSVNAGASPGPVTIIAAFGNFTATFTLTVRPPGPVIAANSFLSAAFSSISSAAAGLVPCGLATVTGAGLAPTLQGVVSGVSGFGPLPYTLNGVSITVGNFPAPIQLVSNQNGVQSVTFQTPCEVQPGLVTVTVTVSGTTASVNAVVVFAAAPGIYHTAGPNGKPYATVVNPSTGRFVDSSNPAVRGGTYLVAVTGLGQVSPAAATNNPGIAGESVVAQVIVGLNNAGVPVSDQPPPSYAAGLIGVYYVGFTIPVDAPTGPDQPLVVAAVANGQIVFSNVTYIPQVN